MERSLSSRSVISKSEMPGLEAMTKDLDETPSLSYGSARPRARSKMMLSCSQKDHRRDQGTRLRFHVKVVCTHEPGC